MSANTDDKLSASPVDPVRRTRPEDRVPFAQKVALGVGAVPYTTGTQIFQVMALPIFQIFLGVHPVLVGLALTVPRFLDAISDPFMGFISDNFRSRWGRRRPFIVLGAVLLAATFAAIWLVPAEWAPGFEEAAAVQAEREITRADMVMFVWLLATGLLFYLAYTVYSVPLMGLSYEMTPDYHERTRVMVYWGFFTMLGNLGINWYYPLTEHKQWFDNPLEGARVVSLVVGIAMFIGLGLLPGLFARERFYHAVAKQKKIRLVPAILETLRSRPMLMLLGMTLSLAFVGAMASALALYIVMFHVCGGDREVGSILNAWNGVGFQVVGFVLLPLLPWLVGRMGKRGLMFLVLSLAALGGVAKWFIFSPDLFFDLPLPAWLSDGTLRLHVLLLDPLLSGPIWVALGVIVPSMMADLCDVDEYEYGNRREGIFGAVFLWMQKIGFSLTFLFTGLAIWLSGFNERLGADQPEHTMFVMRLCFAGFSTLAMLLGMVFLVFYNVSEQRAYEVRALLEQRRGKA